MSAIGYQTVAAKPPSRSDHERAEPEHQRQWDGPNDQCARRSLVVWRPGYRLLPDRA